MWLNLGLILGLASALVAISNDIVAHNKVEIWEHGDIFQTVSGDVAKNIDEGFQHFWNDPKAQNGDWLIQ